jgi:hypothetical protein
MAEPGGAARSAPEPTALRGVSIGPPVSSGKHPRRIHHTARPLPHATAGPRCGAACRHRGSRRRSGIGRAEIPVFPGIVTPSSIPRGAVGGRLQAGVRRVRCGVVPGKTGRPSSCQTEVASFTMVSYGSATKTDLGRDRGSCLQRPGARRVREKKIDSPNQPRPPYVAATAPGPSKGSQLPERLAVHGFIHPFRCPTVLDRVTSLDRQSG